MLRYEIKIKPLTARRRVVSNEYWIYAKKADDPMFVQLDRGLYKIVREIEPGYWTEPFDKWGRWLVPIAIHEHFPRAVFARDQAQQYQLAMSDADRAMFNMLVDHG